MKQAETTHLTYRTDIFKGKHVDIEGNGKVTIRIDYPKNDPEHKVSIEMEREGKTVTHNLNPGDTYTLDHKILVKATRNTQENHVFPIVFKMDGRKYTLNKTKQNKLILTK